MLLVLAVLSGAVIILMAWKDVGVTLKKVLISVDTKRKLKAISEYHYVYFFTASAILIGTAVTVVYKVSEYRVLNLLSSFTHSLMDFVLSLEKGETQYTCSFGMSFQAVKCEVYTCVNRSIFYGVMQFCKYIQDAFSFHSFNPFKLFSVLALVYNCIHSIFSRINLFAICKRSLNNSILLFYSLVFGLHAVHHWRDIVRNVSEEERDLPEEDDVITAVFRGSINGIEAHVVLPDVI